MKKFAKSIPELVDWIGPMFSPDKIQSLRIITTFCDAIGLSYAFGADIARGPFSVGLFITRPNVGHYAGLHPAIGYRLTTEFGFEPQKADIHEIICPSGRGAGSFIEGAASASSSVFLTVRRSPYAFFAKGRARAIFDGSLWPHYKLVCGERRHEAIFSDFLFVHPYSMPRYFGARFLKWVQSKDLIIYPA